MTTYTATSQFTNSQPNNRKRIDYFPETQTFQVSFPYDQFLVEMVKSCFTKRIWDQSKKVWVICSNAANIKQVQMLVSKQNFFLSKEARDFIQEETAHFEKNLTKSSSQLGTLEIKGLGGTLRPYQLAGVEYALENRRTILGDEMGLGKTIQGLAFLQAASAYPALIVCPAILKENWRREITVWLPGKKVLILSGKTSSPIPADIDITIVNYDVLTAWETVLTLVKFQAIILDEAHQIKNHKALRTKCVIRVTKDISYRLALTGTPIINRPSDLISMLTAIDRINDFGGVYMFMKRYCDATGSNKYRKNSGASNLEELNTRLRETAYIRRIKAEVLDNLPAKQRNRIYLDVTTTCRKYDQAKLDTINLIQSQLVLPASNHSKNLAANQHILARLETMKHAAGYAKLDAVSEWAEIFLQETDKKLILYGLHLDIIDALATRLMKICNQVVITGGTSPANRQLYVDQFQNDPTTRLMVANLKVAGIGLNLTAASDVAFAELDWTAASHDQGEDRVHRIGQAEMVSAHYFLASNTIDETIFRMIEKKRQIALMATGSIGEDCSNVYEEIIRELVGQARNKGKRE